MNGNIQLKCSNYVAFSHFHGEAVNNIGYLISYLKKITKYPDGKKIARDIAECWKQDYKRRPAMMDELRKAGF